MADVLRFVASIDVEPEILLDINDEGGWATAVLNVSPPRRRRTLLQSAVQDGSIVTSESYDDRVLTMRLELHAPTHDEGASQVQKLMRLLQRPQWIMWQPTDAVAPLFFRTRAADATLIESIQVQISFHDITLEIPAEPAARGLPVETVFEVGVDPTADGVAYVWPDEVQGDVPVPLQLSLPMPPAGSGELTVLASSTSTAQRVGLPLSSFLPNPGITSVASDSAHPGGQSGKVLENNTFLTCPLPDIAPGLYRVMARLRNNDPATPVPVAVWVGEYTGFNAPALQTKIALDGDGDGDGINDAAVGWRDLGVAHFPSYASPFGGSLQWVPDDYRDGDEPSITIGIDPILAGGADLYAIDVTVVAVMLLPVSPDDAPTPSTYLDIKVANAYAEGTLWIDGEARFAAASDSSSERPVPSALGWPQLVPGLPNTLHVLTDFAADREPLEISARYFPRYLHSRSALS